MRRALLVLALAAACGLPRPAAASISVAAGGMARNNPSQAAAAAILSTGASIPAIPLELQGSLLVPLGGKGGYAATAEIRGFTGGGYGGAYIGAGAGVGTLSNNGSTAAVFTVFAGKSIAPLTSVELRLYRQAQSSGATAAFAGVRFSL